MMRKQRHAVAVATTVLTLVGSGGVAWACTGDPGYPGSTGPTTTGTTTSGTTTTGTTTTTGSTTTTAASTAAAVRQSVRSHAARRARHSRRSG